jgi:hypothetical protein
MHLKKIVIALALAHAAWRRGAEARTSSIADTPRSPGSKQNATSLVSGLRDGSR